MATYASLKYKIGTQITGEIPTAAIADDSVTLAKLASGTDGEVLTWDASGNPAAVAVGTAGNVLTSAGAGAPPTFATKNVINVESVEGNSPAGYTRSDSNSWVSGPTVTYTPKKAGTKLGVMVNVACTGHFWGGSDDDALYAVRMYRVSPSAAELARSHVVTEYPNDRVGGGGDLNAWSTGPHWSSQGHTMVDRFDNAVSLGSAYTFRCDQADAAPSVFDTNNMVWTFWEYE